MWEGKKASSFAIFSIANVLAFVRVLATDFANLVLYYPVVVATLQVLVTTLQVLVTILQVLVTTLQVLVATL